MQAVKTIDRSTLKRYLSQYYKAKRRKRILEERLTEIKLDIKCPPIGAPSLTGMSSGSDVSRGAAALIDREAEIEDKIERQKEALAETALNVIRVLEFLPAESVEREILELRHIDCKTWIQIQRIVHLTRSPCYDYYNRGLDKLLEIPTVQDVLAQYEDGIV